jgi:glucose-6-phosphate 1-dehydrogenase
MNKVTNQSPKSPTSLVIFGATGDLSTTKLFPALIALYQGNRLPDQFRMLGVSRRPFDDEAFRNFLREEVDELHDMRKKGREDFLSAVQFESGDVTNTETYNDIYTHLQAIDKEVGVCLNKLFYLALPPRFYADVGTRFGDSDLMSLCQTDNSWLRMLVEKPYGTDLETAQEIDDVLCETFDSNQLFRIDHYLAKQSLHNVLTLRFRNQLFTGSWNNQYIESIHVRMFETSTIDDRGGFYDQIGAFRDVGQNHLIQLLAAATMEPPRDETPEAIRDARSSLLEDLTLPKGSDRSVVRGQYEGYKSEDGVSSDSETETYFRVPALLDNSRWQGVPIVLESGKGLQEDRVEIELSFRASSSRISSVEPVDGNTMILQFKPNRGVAFDVWVESPELDAGIQHQTIDFSFSPDEGEPPAYVALIDQAMRGEQVMFANNNEVTASWKFTESVVARLVKQELQSYPVGSSGP